MKMSIYFLAPAVLAAAFGGCANPVIDTSGTDAAAAPQLGMDTATVCYHTTWGIADRLSYTIRDGVTIAVATWTMHGHKSVTLVNDRVTAITVY